MSQLITYLLEGSIILLVMYAFYKLLLADLTFFGWNRFYLLATLALASILPLLSFNIPFGSGSIFPSQTFSYDLGEFHLSPTQDNQAQSWILFVILGVYMTGFFVNFGRLLLGIYKTSKAIQSATKYPYKGLTLAIHPSFQPASFFNYILLPNFQQDDRAQELILLHEAVHAAKFHTVDLILVQVVKALFWFHPAIRPIETSLHEVHEFQADACVTNKSPKKEYSQLLLNLIVVQKKPQFVNSFNHFQLKKRIIMMHKEKSNSMQKGRFLFALPVIAIMAMVISCETAVEESFPKTVDFPLAAEEKAEEEGADNLRMLSSNEVFDVVEDSPEFPGGMEAWSKFLSENLSYPSQARNMGIEGTVFLVFEINKDGKINNPEILRGIGGGCDEEALRVINESPDWLPGLQRGRKVNVRMRMPIKFKLS